MNNLLSQSPAVFADRLRTLGISRAAFVLDPRTGKYVASRPELDDITQLLDTDTRDVARHEGIFFAIGQHTGALFSAFVHDTRRGAGQGGLRHWSYATLEALLRDGLRLAKGMTRKSALAGLWWGGGKGIIAAQADRDPQDPGYRHALYQEYGTFVSSLRGCYITAEDAGTVASDMDVVHSSTRFVTCIPPHKGGSGNPSPATALGVVCAMEAALDFLGHGTLAGKTIAMQGVGNVASAMIGDLFDRGVAGIVASDISPTRIDEVARRFAGRPLELRLVEAGDDAILSQPCDIVAPNAMGACLNPDTIPTIRAKIVCGAANNQLADEQRDGAALQDRGILYVPDFVANRMGIVTCANEQYGHVRNDPAIARHFGRDWENSVFRIVQAVLTRATTQATPTSIAANAIADALAAELHPIWGHRGRAIIDGLIDDGWAR